MRCVWRGTKRPPVSWNSTFEHKAEGKRVSRQGDVHGARLSSLRLVHIWRTPATGERFSLSSFEGETSLNTSCAPCALEPGSEAAIPSDSSQHAVIQLVARFGEGGLEEGQRAGRPPGRHCKLLKISELRDPHRRFPERKTILILTGSWEKLTKQLLP